MTLNHPFILSYTLTHTRTILLPLRLVRLILDGFRLVWFFLYAMRVAYIMYEMYEDKDMQLICIAKQLRFVRKTMSQDAGWLHFQSGLNHHVISMHNDGCCWPIVGKLYWIYFQIKSNILIKKRKCMTMNVRASIYRQIYFVIKTSILNFNKRKFSTVSWRHYNDI